MRNIVKRKRGDTRKFMLDGEMRKFKLTSVAHGERSLEARKAGAKRNNYYVRALHEERNDYSIWIRKEF